MSALIGTTFPLPELTGVHLLLLLLCGNYPRHSRILRTHLKLENLETCTNLSGKWREEETMTTHPLGSFRIVASLFYEETEKRKHFVQLLNVFSIVLRRTRKECISLLCWQPSNPLRRCIYVIPTFFLDSQQEHISHVANSWKKKCVPVNVLLAQIPAALSLAFYNICNWIYQLVRTRGGWYT